MGTDVYHSIVATLSMYTSGWAIFVLLVTYFAECNNAESQQY
jgi:hypothetical protein